MRVWSSSWRLRSASMCDLQTCRLCKRLPWVQSETCASVTSTSTWSFTELWCARKLWRIERRRKTLHASLAARFTLLSLTSTSILGSCCHPFAEAKSKRNPILSSKWSSTWRNGGVGSRRVPMGWWAWGQRSGNVTTSGLCPSTAPPSIKTTKKSKFKKSTRHWSQASFPGQPSSLSKTTWSI